MAADWFLGRVVWDIHSVWGLLGYYSGLCEEYSGHWAVHWDGG